MGLHTGEAELREGDYYGQSLNRAARIMTAGHGGQVLLSDVAAQVVREHLPADTTLLDLGEHHLKGLLHAEKIYQLVAPDLQKDFPPLNSVSTATNNLPAQLTSFIGRERELRDAKEKLSPSPAGRGVRGEGARLLTLIGPGGTGKTRLSLQLGAEVLPNFADGVWFIELAPLADPTLILQTVASVLGVRAQMGMGLANIVMDFLRARNLLLIFDNCEHLVEACAQLADEFLRNAPNIKIIASSREALGIGGETIYRVPSLSLPNQAQASREALAGFESIQLFVERARAANPKFDLTEKNASSVAQICRRLDGIPLALELAAARVSVFSAEQIATRLDDRFKLLTGGSRTALPRQQTLRALIDWSYDMLSDEERALLRRLSVFAGGWTFEGAEYVCPKNDVLDLLSQLVNKSLVIVDEEGETTRYRLLETIRQYTRDKLLDTGESVEARNIHAEYFLKFCETAEPHLLKAKSARWVNLLEAEYDNIRASLEWLMENNIDVALRIISSLQFFWNRRGYEGEGRAWCETAIAKLESLPPVGGEAVLRHKKSIGHVYNVMGAMATSQGDNDFAAKISEKCAVLAREIGDNDLLLRSLVYTASGRIVTGNIENPDDLIKEVLEVSKGVADNFSKGMAHGLVADLLMFSGKDDELINEHLTKSKNFAIQGDVQWGYAMMMLGVGMVAKYRGKFDTSRESLASSLPLFHEMGDMHRVSMIKSEYAHMDRYEGQIEKAENAYRETIIEWQKLGHRAAVANQLECLAFIAKMREQPERAAKLLGAAEILREKINIQMSQFERIEYDQHVADLKNGLDEKTFRSLWAEGRAMTMEQAIELALQGQP